MRKLETWERVRIEDRLLILKCRVSEYEAGKLDHLKGYTPREYELDQQEIEIILERLGGQRHLDSTQIESLRLQKLGSSLYLYPFGRRK